MSTETTKTQEKKLETLEEAAMAVLNEEHKLIDRDALILYRRRMYDASEALKKIYEDIQNIRKTVFDVKTEKTIGTGIFVRGGEEELNNQGKVREAFNTAADSIKFIINACIKIGKIQKETGNKPNMGVMY